MPAKNASVSRGIGAAPETAHRSSSNPSFSRSFESTRSSACCHSAANSLDGASPASRTAAFFAATDIAHCRAWRFASSGSWVVANSIAALSFSHTRGTAPHVVGCTSDNAAAISRASETTVT